MAVKIIGAAPNGNLLGTGSTQDLMMINNPRFFIRTTADYLLFQETIIRDGKPDAFFLYRAIREALAEAGLANAESVSQDVINEVAAGVVALGNKNPIPLEGAVLKNFPLHALSLNIKLLENSRL